MKQPVKKYKCPLCIDKFDSEDVTMKHLGDFHHFTKEKVAKLGLKIKIVS